ncbi:MAG: hypothetical protein IPH09_10630 [bacterium]|nr:hypothetical protein [bacterium]
MATMGWILPLAVILARYGPGHLLVNLWILQYEFQMQFLGYLNLVGILVFPAVPDQMQPDRSPLARSYSRAAFLGGPRARRE